MNIPELFLNQARMGFDIFVEYMIQRIYENFVGIFMEDRNVGCFTTQGKQGYSFNRKGIFQGIKIRGCLTWSWDGFESDKPLGRGIRNDLPGFQDHKAIEKELQMKIQRNPKEKERAKNRGVTGARDF